MSSGRPPPSTTPAPPKASQTRGPSTRRQSANSISPAIGRTTENMLRHPAFEGHNASDEPSARKLLVEHGFLSLNTDPSHTQICNTLLCLTFATGVNAQVADVIRATALIVESLSPGIPTSAEANPPALAPMQQQIDRLTMIVDEIKAATDSNSKSAATIAELTESTKKELESTSLNVSRAANAHTSNLASSPSPPSATGPQKASYADIARYSTHAKATALCESQTRTVRITPSQDSAPSWEDLTELVLVEKANEALDLARTTTEDIPTDAKFLSARKSKSGSILYEVNTEEAAAWLRSPEGRVLFTANFGPDVSLETRPFSIIAEYVPVGTKTDDPQTLRTIESTNSLPAGAIRSMRWIKPIERRTPNQRHAHAIIDFFSPTDANAAIRHPFSIQSKKTPTRRLLPEPTRCLKCQSFENGHFAKNCRYSHDVCGTCAGNHRTSACSVSRQEDRYCANCKSRGHAAWDRKCPIFAELMTRYHSKLPDANYRFFPIADDHSSWELESQESGSHAGDSRAARTRPTPQPHPMFRNEEQRNSVHRNRNSSPSGRPSPPAPTPTDSQGPSQPNEATASNPLATASSDTPSSSPYDSALSMFTS